MLPGTADLTAAAVTAGSTAGLTFTYFTDAAGTIILGTPNAVAASGTYYIRGTTAAGCSDIQPVLVTINPAPTVVINNPAAVCAPGTVDLTAAAVTAGSTAGLTLTYFTDAAGTIALGTPNAVATSGTYYIRGTTAAGCSDIQPVVVKINPAPTLVINNPAAVCAPATVTLLLHQSLLVLLPVSPLLTSLMRPEESLLVHQMPSPPAELITSGELRLVVAVISSLSLSRSILHQQL